MLLRIRIGILACSLALGIGPAAAAEITLFPARDNTLFQDEQGSVSNGSGPALFAGQTHAAPVRSVRRALLAFDIAALVPPPARIDSVELTLTMNRTIDASASIQRLHRVQADWGEDRSDSSGGGLGGGGGAPAETGDATWLHRVFPATLWSTPGGDFAPAASAQASIGGTIATGQAFTWGSTPALVADVQGWLDAPATNFGWIVIGDETLAAGVPTARRFGSRESPLEAERPRLVVWFTTVGVEARTFTAVKALFR